MREIKLLPVLQNLRGAYAVDFSKKHGIYREIDHGYRAEDQKVQAPRIGETHGAGYVRNEVRADCVDYLLR